MSMKGDITFERGPSGKGELRCLKNGVKIVAEDGTVYEDITYDAVYCPLPEDAGQGKSYGPIYYRLNKDKTALYQASPYGTETENEFYVRYKWIPHKEGDPIKTFNVKGKEIRYPSGYRDWRPEHEAFNVELEIVAGRFKGAVLKKMFAYQFVEDEETGNTMVQGHGSWFGRWASEILKFLRVSGYDQDDKVVWSDDPSIVLAGLNAVLADKDQVFRVKVNNGWVNEFDTVPDGVTVG